MNLYLAWRVSRFEHLLSKKLSEVFNLKNSECVLANSHDTIGALGRAEWRNVLKSFVANRCHSMLAHVAVAEPRLVRESYHRILPVLLYFCQLDSASAEELLSAVAHHTCHVINKLAHKNTIF